jgi:hypothetical protein
MNRFLRVVAGFVALALLAGPMAAACGSCCPEAAAQVSVTAPQGCCGDCEPTVERAPDPASLAAKGTSAPSAAQAVYQAEAAGPLRVELVSHPDPRPGPRLLPPLASPAPLRL